MQNRIQKYYFCDHKNLIPAWFINSNLYIFLCKDCDTFILRDFKYLGHYL